MLFIICSKHVCTVKGNGVWIECTCVLHTVVVPHTVHMVQHYSSAFLYCNLCRQRSVLTTELLKLIVTASAAAAGSGLCARSLCLLLTIFIP